MGTVREKVVSAIELGQTQPGWMWPRGQQEGRERRMEAHRTGPVYHAKDLERTLCGGMETHNPLSYLVEMGQRGKD